jgi:lipocalin
MKFRHQVLRVLPVVMLACSLLPGPAWAQFSQQAKLVGTDVVGAFAEQGTSVSLSGDGNTAIVGGPGDNDYIDAAWVYTRSGEVWNQQGPKLVGTGAVNLGDVFQGWSVALSSDGNTAIVGGPQDDVGTGAAWVYTRSRGAWSQQGPKLIGTGAVGRTFQGFSTSLSGDGSTAIVGGPGDNSGAGAAWVYAQPVFAGTPGKANCHGQSVSALTRQFGGLNGAAAVLGFSSVGALQSAILAFCGG